MRGRELFGHSRGAFTGAVGDKAGLFEEADGGTFFLDEIPDLSPRGQAKLLRVLHQHEVRRVGETFSRKVDVRLVAAVNRDLSIHQPRAITTWAPQSFSSLTRLPPRIISFCASGISAFRMLSIASGQL